MAMDWIKMRCNLWDDPRVGALVEATGTCEATIIGGLYWLWATADQHTEDGVMRNLSLFHIDRKTGIKGLGQALVTIGWLVLDDSGSMNVARFSEHNGESGKLRASTAKRVAKHRVTRVDESGNATSVTKSVHQRYLEQEQEQEREKEESKAKATGQQADQRAADSGEAPAEKSAGRKPQTAKRFPEFWAAYPVKKGRADAEKKWKTKGCDALADTIIAHVRLMEREDDQWRRGFIPHGSTYVNGEHWTDEPVKDKDAVKVTTPAAAPETFGPKAALARSESRLENAIGYIRQQFSNGVYGEGEHAVSERDRLIAEATEKYRGGP